MKHMERSLSNRLGYLGLLVSAVGIASTGAAGCGASDDGSGKPADVAAAAPAAPPPVALRDEVAVDEISVFQAVKATLVKEGALVATPNAPIIANRPAYVRVFVKATARTRPVLEGELRVKRAGREDLVLRDSGKRVLPELDEEEVETTLNFSIPAEEMTADASFSFKAGVSTAGADVVTFPAEGGVVPFGASMSSQKLRVKLVPVSYATASGAALTPAVTDLSVYRDTLYKLYPVASIELSVREPITWTSAIDANGKGWDALLSNIVATRRADNVDRDVYYVGMFTPKATIDEFCDAGRCVLGLAPLAEEREVGLRAAIVLGYGGNGTAGTMAHELAHAMGRGHAPCGAPAGVDDDFPYGTGSIGVWGYDILTKRLINPGRRYRDFMSYCGPEWVSDYTYRGIFERMGVVTKQQVAIAAGPATGGAPGARPSELIQTFNVGADGTVVQGAEIETLPEIETHGGGEHVTVSYEGATGQVFATAKARVRRLSEFGGSIVLAPSAPAGAIRARLSGIGVASIVRLAPRTAR